MTPQDGLVYAMVLVSAADRNMTDLELERLRGLVDRLPIFRRYSQTKLADAAEACAKTLSGKNGLDRTLAAIGKGVPKRLATTAYALACDIAAAEGTVKIEEMQLLDLLADALSINRLEQEAIHFAAGARYRKG
ncbi:MAG: tellurite resistance TerB family protein [Reyranellaceae bacterium]